MGGALGHIDCFFCCAVGAGSMVIARREGRGRCVTVPSRRISPHTRSAWMRGTSSIETVRSSSLSREPPSASRPDTIDSQGS